MRTISSGTIAGLTLAALALTGCGLDSLAESAVENAVEKAIEIDSGEDVDLDFGSGGLSISTDEGSLEFDAETGEFVVVDESGEVISGSIDQSGLNVDSTEGSLTFNAETGKFEVVNAEGEQVADGTLSEDGTIDATFDSDEGQATLRSGPELASEWPSEVIAPYPNATVVQAGQFDNETAFTRLLILRTDDSPAEVFAFYDDATDGWEGARTTGADGIVLAVTKDTTSVQITASQSADGTDISLTLVESAGDDS